MAENKGSQQISVKYHDPVNSDIVNRRFYQTRPIGLYKGGYITYTLGSNTVNVTQLVAEIRDVNGLLNQIRVNTGALVTVEVSEAAPYVVLRWTHTEDEATDYVEFKAVATPGKYDVIIAKMNYAGGSLSGVDYGFRTFANDRGSHCKVVPSYPSAQTTKVNVLPGVVRTGTGYVLVNDQYSNGEVSLSGFPSGPASYVFVYMTNAGIIGTTSTISMAKGHILLARVLKDGFEIDQDHILDLRAFLTYPALPDNTSLVYDSNGLLSIGQQTEFYSLTNTIINDAIIDDVDHTKAGVLLEAAFPSASVGSIGYVRSQMRVTEHGHNGTIFRYQWQVYPYRLKNNGNWAKAGNSWTV